MANLAAYGHTMPPSAPDSLADQAYRKIVAYILRVHGHEAGDEEFPADDEALQRMTIGG
ncbi:hypothetical protein [Fodinicurvata sp. EGI_FJ10296]|uniref:hypothetical protein n=1 Tax=Fodinicurvata sp. EGI_FJ10296 TaxID=3231908 RepID=UPI003456D296